jgi:SAM-dependent methyltransferase
VNDVEKLRHLLPHWLEHNAEHAAEFRTWAERARSAGEEHLAGCLEAAVEKMAAANIVLPRLLKVVGPAARVLEVGPGSGAFTLPLAAAVREVAAVEPSPAMRSVLNRRLGRLPGPGGGAGPGHSYARRARPG